MLNTIYTINENEMQKAVEIATAKFEELLGYYGFWEVEEDNFLSYAQERQYLSSIWQQATWKLSTWINTNYGDEPEYIKDILFNEPQEHFYL